MNTKILCTIGPACDTEDKMRELIKAGMRVARLNCSHGTNDQRRKTVAILKRLRKEMDVPDLKIMWDTKGPEIRIGRFGDAFEKTGKNGFVDLKEGQMFTFHVNPVAGDIKGVSVNYARFAEVVGKGQELLLNDGMIKMVVESKTNDTVTARVLNCGVLSDRKSLFVPGCDLQLPFISDADRIDFEAACEVDPDWVAISFVGSAQDVRDVRALLAKHGKSYPIMGKVESVCGIENIDEILKVIDGIVVARGDLGVEYPVEQVPPLQKMLIEKTRKAGKISINATEMLESMIEKPRPTRAETTDIANSVWDGAQYVWLSGETAMGKFPVLCVQYMARICAEAEKYLAQYGRKY